MPLVYDDSPGSWGRASVLWPSLDFDNHEDAMRAYIACTKGHVVPYGSYVLVEHSLRVETKEHRNRLKEYLAASPHKTYASLREHYIATGEWER